MADMFIVFLFLLCFFFICTFTMEVVTYISMGSLTNIFEGDVLVLYGLASIQLPSSPRNAQFVHLDLIDVH